LLKYASKQTFTERFLLLLFQYTSYRIRLEVADIWAGNLANPVSRVMQGSRIRCGAQEEDQAFMVVGRRASDSRSAFS
jgi:hypothetical protein